LELKLSKRRVLAAAAIVVAAGTVAAASSHRPRVAQTGPRFLAPATVGGHASAQGTSGKPKPITVTPEVKHDTSLPLRSIEPKRKHKARTIRREPERPIPAGTRGADPVVQSSAPAQFSPTAGLSFQGIAAQNSMPPDPNGAAGQNAFVEIVNQQFAVYSKATGAVLYGPADTNTLWAGFGGACQSYNQGDATVAYDRIANRWIIQQFGFADDQFETGPYFECIAVSQTSDPTGSWNRYAFNSFGSDFPDYPKLAVWPDAYYVSYNLFGDIAGTGGTWDGPRVCAYDRTKMLAGQAATEQCASIDPTSYPTLSGVLPSDLDGPTAPPAGSPNFVLGFESDPDPVLDLWKFHVDWSHPGNTALNGPTPISVAAFNPACDPCVPQKGTSQLLDSLGDRLMYRLAYRNFGDHESLVVTHSVQTGSSMTSPVGERWYELRDPNGTPVVQQQGTYAPSGGQSRWMGSAAMDANGDIALGYSLSSSTTYPSIAYTGRLAGDPLGTMTQGETILKAGLGSQDANFPQADERWGDYSSMSIDPADDCTFWYTNQWLPAGLGDFNWKTWVGSFSLPGCAAAVGNRFSMTPTPDTVTVQQGGSGDTSVGTAVTSGSPQSVDLSAGVLPFDTTVSFSPDSLTTGAASDMTIAVGPGTPVGTYTITVYGTGPGDIETTNVKLVVTLHNAVTNGDFENATDPLTGWTTAGSVIPVAGPTKPKKAPTTPPHSAQIGSKSVVAGDSTLSQTVVVPTNGSPTLTFWYQPHCSSPKMGDLLQAQLRTTGGSTLATVLGLCVNSSTWKKIAFDASAYAGQTIVLWFNAHSSGTRGKLTYFLLDDVVLGNQPGVNAVHNAGFETPSLASWTAGGTLAPVSSPTKHSGTASAQLGSPSPFDGDSSLTQQIVVPGINPTLTFWYQARCTDTIDFDQITVQIRSTADKVLATVLNVCANSTKWKQVSFSMSQFAGQSVVVYLNVHDDDNPGDPTYALFDDFSLT